MSYNASAHYAAESSSKITPIGFSSQSLASYLAENGHDIRQMTIIFPVLKR